jgi:hypothetical protein
MKNRRSNKMIVYVVTFRHNDTFEVMGVFTTVSQALLYIEKQRHPLDYDFTPFVLDKEYFDKGE